MNEFPDSKQLVDHYSTDKRVSFLYLCSPYGKLDDEFRWKRYVQKYGLKGHHILLTEEAYFGIYKEIESNPDQRNYIPRHLLVKNGKLVVANAPSPSSKAEVIALIDSLRN